MSKDQQLPVIDPIQAIKAAVKATQEANKAGGKQNTEILNAVAKTLGFKDFRALQHSVASSKASPVVQKPLDFKPFTLVQEAYDEMVDRVSFKIDVATAMRMIELSAGAVSMKSDVPYPEWQEEPVGRGTSVAVRPVLGGDGAVFLEAETANKYSASNVSVQGEMDLKEMLDFVSGDAQHKDSLDPEQWFLWKAQTRELFLFADSDSRLVEDLLEDAQ